MRVLALDVATRMGWAYGSPGSVPRSGAYDLSVVRDYDARFARVMYFVREWHTAAAPDLIAIEAAIGGKDANAYLIGLVACIRGQATSLGIQTVEYASSSVRKHFIGKHLTTQHFPGLTRAKAQIEIKARVVNQCKSLGWQVNGHDEADAMALWSLACAKESREHQMTDIGGLFGEQK